MTHYLVLSDLHLGHPDALLSHPQALERLEAELERADALALNGDLFDLLIAPLESCVDASRPFFDLVSQHIEQVVYVPGNHDYHFVAHEEDRARLAAVSGGPDQKPFRLQSAEWLLSSLTKGRVEVRAHYPQVEIAGATLIHGHYTDPHLGGLINRLGARLGRRLAGIQAASPDLQAADYEALFAPLTELLYRTAQLPSSRRTWQSAERALVYVAGLIRAPALLRRTLLSWRRNTTQQTDDVTGLDLSVGPFSLVSPAEACEAMRQVFANLGLPAGEYLIGHTHVPFAPRRCGPYTVANSGSWYYGRRHSRHPLYRQLAWPGAALRKEAGHPAELVRLLDDVEEDELRSWLDGRKAKGRRRLLPGRSRRLAGR